jgi:uncharacterized protein (TIGR03086 family)
MTALLRGVDDSQLTAPTPCPDTTVGDLIDHIGMFAVRFTASADKARSSSDGPPPRPSAAHLGAGWRDRIGSDLDGLASAWDNPLAWEGFTSAGGLDLPASVVGVVALDELVVHGWDISVATGQPYSPSSEEVGASIALVADLDAPRDGSLFGPIVPVPDDASELDRLLGLTGRDPGWSPTGA